MATVKMALHLVPWTAADDARLRELRAQSPPAPYPECARRLRRTAVAVKHRAKLLGLAGPKAAPVEARRVAAAHAAGAHPAAIAAQLGCSEGAVRACLRRQRLMPHQEAPRPKPAETASARFNRRAVR